MNKHDRSVQATLLHQHAGSARLNHHHRAGRVLDVRGRAQDVSQHIGNAHHCYGLVPALIVSDEQTVHLGGAQFADNLKAQNTTG